MCDKSLFLNTQRKTNRIRRNQTLEKVNMKILHIKQITGTQ